jgi:beta-glucosidase
LSAIGPDNKRAITPGRYEISVGGKQPGFQGVLDAATTEVITKNIRLTGEAVALD